MIKTMFNMYVDADSIPKALRPIILRANSRTGGLCVFVADRSLPDIASFINTDTYVKRVASGDKTVKSNVRMTVVKTGENSADNTLVDIAEEGSLCITHDIPLASRLLEKGCVVVDDRGSEYTMENIKSLLTGREVNNTLREAGIFSEQQKSRTSNNVKDFADNLDRVLTRMLKLS
ncbi:MAG: DUF188 domain-containing protein [Spirochaetales bacterium]